MTVLICVSLVTGLSLDVAVADTLSCSPDLRDVYMLSGTLI